MRKILIYPFLCFSTLFFNACTLEQLQVGLDILLPDGTYRPIDYKKLDSIKTDLPLVWKERLYDTLKPSNLGHLAVSSQNIVFGTSSYPYLGKELQTGKTVWEKNISGNGTTYFDWEDIGAVYNDEMITYTSTERIFKVFSLQTGEILKAKEVTNGRLDYNRMTFANGNFYFFIERNDSTHSVYRYQSQKNEIDSLFTLSSKGTGYESLIRSLSEYQNEQGDTLLLAVNYLSQNRLSDGSKNNLFAYNITKRKTEFERKGEVGDSLSGYSLEPTAIVQNQIAVIQGKKTVGFDLKGKKIAWAEDLGWIDERVVYKNRLIIKTNYEGLRCVETETGKGVWQRTDVGRYDTKLILHNDVLYANDGTFYALDAENGANLQKAPSPLSHLQWTDKPKFNNKIMAISEKEGLLFLSDGYNFYAVKTFR